ncbi:RNA/RNP complex-1-interacting phosphatase-like [Saccostrea cucullata]|uniref:RNA/RNP complex-1-interacting phosphatase-like n=1 Tax=Saccostrea cuccullata TaxID=36930 RepID=UPI002ED2BD58
MISGNLFSFSVILKKSSNIFLIPLPLVPSSRVISSTKQPPNRWETYLPLGKVIPGTRLITFKVPLKKAKCEKLPKHEQFTPTHLVSKIRDAGFELGMVVDLTFTRKYYSPSEFHHQGIRYEKIFTEGHNIPNDDVVNRFFDALEGFYESNVNEIFNESRGYSIERENLLQDLKRRKA